MSNSIITVQDAGGANQTIAKVPDTGRAAAALSLPMTLSTEDQTVQAAISASMATLVATAANQATQATQALISANMATLTATAANQATQATQALISASMATLVATAANQATQTTLAAVAASLATLTATAANQATQTTLAAINSNIPAAKVAALATTVPVTSLAAVGSVTFNRPNDIVAYTAGDVMGSSTGANGAVLNFSSFVNAGGGDVMLTGNDLRVDSATLPTGATSFRLHLYNASPASALGDNAAWSLTANDRVSYLGYVDMGVLAVAGNTTCWTQADGLAKQIRLPAGNLYAYLVTNGAIQPAVSTPLTIGLRGVGV